MPAVAVILIFFPNTYVFPSYLLATWEFTNSNYVLQYYMLALLNFMSLLFTVSLNVLQKHDLNSLIEYTVFDYMAIP